MYLLVYKMTFSELKIIPKMALDLYMSHKYWVQISM